MENFEIISKLGSGGFSKVYKVKRKIDNQIYALKKVQILNLSEKQKLNSLNEIRVLASIKNKYIVNYKEAFLDEKDCSLCLVMEYADRGDLANRIKQQKEKGKYFNEKDIWKVFIQLVKGLKSLHDMDILHRDIKCSNIFLFSDGVAKLGDLNVCKILSNDILGHTQAGTPAYAAPEVWMEKPYGLKSDIWSLGCVLYEMVTLHVPFRAENMVKLYNKVLIGEYIKIPNKFSDELGWIISQMINSDINKRLTCEEILNCECIKNKLEENTNINKKCASEKTISSYKMKSNFKNNDFNYNNICNNEENKEGEEQELLRTIYMPYNFLYLKDELPKPNYSQEIKKKKNSSLSNTNKLLNINNESATLTYIPNKLTSDSSKKYLSKIRKLYHEPMYCFQQNNDKNKIILNNKDKDKDNSGQIKIKSINSQRDAKNCISLENRVKKEDNISENPIRKSTSNLNKKIKDYLYKYEKEKEIKIKDENIIEKKIKEKTLDLNNLNYINNDKLKYMFKIRKFRNNSFKIKIKKDEKNFELNRICNSNTIINNRYNNDCNEISNDINKKCINTNCKQNNNNYLDCTSNININNNLISNNINCYKYNKNELKFFYNNFNKKSSDTLPKIKLSHFKRLNNDK